MSDGVLAGTVRPAGAEEKLSVLIDTVSGERGEIADWVATFGALWSGGRANLDRFMDLFSPDVRLAAPGFRPTTGRDAGLRAFSRTFAALPDLTAELHGWSASLTAGPDGAASGLLFVEMTFTATLGGRLTRWRNVDRFEFRGGVAAERVAFLDPTRVRRALLRNLSGWRQLLRLRLGR